MVCGKYIVMDPVQIACLITEDVCVNNGLVLEGWEDIGIVSPVLKNEYVDNEYVDNGFVIEGRLSDGELEDIQKVKMGLAPANGEILDIAAKSGNVEVVKLVLGAGVKPRQALVQYFEELGANPNPQVDELLVASISNMPPIKLLEIIPEIGKNEDMVQYGPMRADAIEFMLKHNRELAKATNTSAEEFKNNHYYNYEFWLSKAWGRLVKRGRSVMPK